MKMPVNYYVRGFVYAILPSFWISCSQEHTIRSGDLEFRIDRQLHVQVNSLDTGARPLTSGFQPADYLVLDKELLTDFPLTARHEAHIANRAGEGVRYVFEGFNAEKGIQKTLIVTRYPEFPDLLTTQVHYHNRSEKDLLIKAWVNHAYTILSHDDEPPFWAFQGSSSNARTNWIKPVTQGFYQKNYMGMNSSDYGGGIPVTDLWRPDAGICVGHTELTPRLVSLPTQLKKYATEARLSIQQEFEYPYYLKAGDTLSTVETFVAVHSGDYFNALRKYATFMQAKGIGVAKSEPAAFEPVWCAWGYERNFTLEEVTATLPKVKELGIKWAVLDDGYQQAEGDWHTSRDKLPGGDAQMKALVDKIHSYGLKAKLWWAPLAADPGSRLLEENPGMRLYLEDWAPQYITWWDAYYLSPTHPRTIRHTKEMVRLFLGEWDFDGLKMDGQHMNAIAPDHNPGSGLSDPVEGPQRLPEFFKTIYDEALAIKSGAVIENCPCGTCMSYFNMPYMNQAVASDPTSSWQVRLKGKTYKALIPHTAYYGDHVELSDGGTDFASSFGVGAVLGTKFTWPRDNPSASASHLLTPEKEAVWKKWFALYNEKMLSKETYLGDLYDIGYDKPETHVIRKGDTLYYAFYAPDWSGEVVLRGLQDLNYTVFDYVNQTGLEPVSGKKPVLKVAFEGFKLIEVYPQGKNEPGKQAN